eukprot:6601459-Prorocentrum_lima.AAC.1
MATLAFSNKCNEGNQHASCIDTIMTLTKDHLHNAKVSIQGPATQIPNCQQKATLDANKCEKQTQTS